MADPNTGKDASAADAEHDESALRDAEEKMLRPDSTEDAQQTDDEDPSGIEHDEKALRDAEKKMLLHNENSG